MKLNIRRLTSTIVKQVFEASQRAQPTLKAFFSSLDVRSDAMRISERAGKEVDSVIWSWKAPLLEVFVWLRTCVRVPECHLAHVSGVLCYRVSVQKIGIIEEDALGVEKEKEKEKE